MVINILIVDIAQNDTTICEGDSLVLSSNISFSIKNLDTIVTVGDVFEYSVNEEIGWENNIGTWTTGNAPFGSNAVHNNPLFNAQTNWDENSSIYLRKQIDLTNHNLDSIHWFIAVDNGYELYVNGNLVSSDMQPGSLFRWEYDGYFSADLLNSGNNIVALKLTDNGGPSAFDMMIAEDILNPLSLSLIHI